jgi:hypothetical protein
VVLLGAVNSSKLEFEPAAATALLLRPGRSVSRDILEALGDAMAKEALYTIVMFACMPQQEARVVVGVAVNQQCCKTCECRTLSEGKTVVCSLLPAAQQLQHQNKWDICKSECCVRMPPTC